MPWAWRCPKSGAGGDSALWQATITRRVILGNVARNGARPLLAWTWGRKGCLRVRTRRISVRRPWVGRFCGAGLRHTAQSQMPTDSSATRREVATVRNPAGTTPSGPETRIYQVVPRGTRTSWNREIFRDLVQAPAYAVAKATGRCQRERERRKLNFCLLAWETSGVAGHLWASSPRDHGFCSRRCPYLWGPWAGSRDSCPLASWRSWRIWWSSSPYSGPG